MEYTDATYEETVAEILSVDLATRLIVTMAEKVLMDRGISPKLRALLNLKLGEAYLVREQIDEAATCLVTAFGLALAVEPDLELLIPVVERLATFYTNQDMPEDALRVVRVAQEVIFSYDRMRTLDSGAVAQAVSGFRILREILGLPAV